MVAWRAVEEPSKTTSGATDPPWPYADHGFTEHDGAVELHMGTRFQGIFLTAGTESLLDKISLRNTWAQLFHVGMRTLDGKQGSMQGSKTLYKGRIPPVRERLFASD